MVQWLRICLPLQGTQAPPLVQEDPTRRRAAKPVDHSYWSPCLLEPVFCHKRSPHTTTREQSPLTTTREDPHAATKAQHSRHYYYFKKENLRNVVEMDPGTRGSLGRRHGSWAEPQKLGGCGGNSGRGEGVDARGRNMCRMQDAWWGLPADLGR